MKSNNFCEQEQDLSKDGFRTGRKLSIRSKWKRLVRKSDIPRTLRAILLYLVEKMNLDGSRCYPTQEQIAEATGYTRETVNRWLKKAVSLGWIRVIQNKWGKKWRNNLYIPRNPNDDSCDINRVTFTNTIENQHDHTTNTLRVKSQKPRETPRKNTQNSEPKTRWEEHAKPLSQSKSPPLHSFIRPAGEVMAPDGSISRFPLTNPSTGQKWTGVQQIAEAIFGSARRVEEYFFPPASPNNTGPRDVSLSGTENIDFGLEADYQAWSDSLTAESDSRLDAECQAWVAAYEGAREWS